DRLAWRAPEGGAAQRWAADGGGQPRRQARLRVELALPVLGRAVLPRGHPRLDRQARRQRRHVARSRVPHPVRGRAPASDPPGRRGRVFGLLLLLVMSADAIAPWVGLALLGAYHGVNPAMGWLFAVALGLQEGRRSAVLRALPAIALGHEAAISLAVVLVLGLQLVADPGALRLASAALLVAFAAYKLWRPRSHPRWL